MKIGYALSSEEHSAIDLVKNAVIAEKTGFNFAFISDHFHPWVDQQPHSPFVWSVMGGIAQATSKIIVGTGVTAPIIRIHPAIIAQAAATTASMMEERFILGLGTGENLNEHVIGLGWPTIGIRQEMLEEAIEIIRELWKGKNYSYNGTYYTVEDAKIYSLPKNLPPIYIAASGTSTAKKAGKLVDGLISTSPDKKLVDIFNKASKSNQPKVGQFKVVVADNKEKALDTLLKWWPNSGIKGQLSQELRIPAYFEDALKMTSKDEIADKSILGKNKKEHLEKIEEFEKAGFTHVYVHQIGPDQQAFFNFYKKEILPEFN